MKRSLIIGLALVAALIVPGTAEAIPVIPAPRTNPGIITDPICIFDHSDPSCVSTTPPFPLQRHSRGWRGRYRGDGAARWRTIDPSFSVKIPDRSRDHGLVITPQGQGWDPYFFVSPISGDAIFSS
jgi:hypothetical protein